MVSLSPPWNRIFREENVSLKCTVNNSIEDSPTQWTHNSTLLSKKTSVLDIVNAQVSNSGEYRCQNREFMWSDPVSLQIFSGKFQGGGNIHSSMWGMSHPQMGRKLVMPKLRARGGTPGLSLRHTSRLLFGLHSTFWPFPSFPSTLFHLYHFYISSNVYYLVKWNTGYVNTANSWNRIKRFDLKICSAGSMCYNLNVRLHSSF